LGGYYGLLRWGNFRGVRTLPNSSYDKSINALRNELSTAPSYSASEVGYYNFEYDTATTIQAMSEMRFGSFSACISYPSTVTPLYHATVARPRGGNLKFGGALIADSSDDSGARDVIADGLAPSSGTSYCNGGSGPGDAEVDIAHLMIYK